MKRTVRRIIGFRLVVIFKNRALGKAGFTRSAVVLLAAAILAFSGQVNGTERFMTILTWSGYLDPMPLEEFERQFGVAITEVYIDGDSARDMLLSQAESNNFDLAFVDGTQIRFYRAQNWLCEIATTAVPNLHYIDRRWLSYYPATEGYTLPSLWGTTGIACRRDLVSEPITSWAQLLTPSADLCGKLVKTREPQDVVEMALRTLGHSPGTQHVNHLANVEALLLEQRECVANYGYVDLGEQSKMPSGDIQAAMMYNGDATLLQKRNPDVAFVLPSEGSELWADFLVVLQPSLQKADALKIVKFMAEPSNAARQAVHAQYATWNSSAFDMLPDEFRANPIIYPTDNDLDCLDFDRIYSRLLAREHNRLAFQLFD